MIIDDGSGNKNFIENINPNSWIKKQGFIEKADYNVGESFQFIRDGYYNVDKESTMENVIFNRIVSLKSSFK